MNKLPQSEWGHDFDLHFPCGNVAAQHALDEYPRESCGLLIVERGRHVYVPCANLAKDGDVQFHMNPADYAAAEARGEVLAVIHSHPDVAAAPSAADRVMCEASALPWHIVAVHKDVDTVRPVAAASVEPCGYKLPLLGRPFVHGLIDCYSLIKDYYSQELGIELPHFDREDNWWNNGQDLYVEHFRDAGFDLAAGPMQPHDVVLMQIRSPKTNHGGVYIGDTMIMHHMYGRLSSRDIYGGYLREATRMIVRHKDLA